jgi:hypothetical protein
MLWNARYDNATSEHVFTGRLLRLNGTAIQNKDVKILNETQVAMLQTNQTGFVEYRRHFDAGDETITYNVRVAFEGTDAQQATLNATTFDGTEYTVCTVTYFQFKPSANMTTVTVEPHATEVTVPIKSPEELQEEAQQAGSLSIWHEFFWWPPFYRFHMIYLLNSSPQFDVGIGIASSTLQGFQSFIDRISQYARDIVPDLFADYILGEMVAFVGALSGNLAIWTFAAAASIGIKLYLIWADSWNSVERLRTEYLAQIVSLMIEVGSFVAEFSLGNLIKAGVELAKGAKAAVWSILTLIANILLDICLFLNVIDSRLLELQGR